MLAGISVEFYTRLERGNATGVSADVLNGIVRALQLDVDERGHLFALVRAASTAGAPQRRPPQERVRRPVQQILDSMSGVPAFVRNAHLDVLAANQVGRAFYSPLFDDPARPVNSARFVFLNERATEFFLDWDTIANDAVGILRAEAGRDPYDKRLSDLIGALSTRSEEFRVRWAAHNVKLHRTGVKRFHHPVVGDLTLNFEALELPGDPRQTLLVYAAEPRSPSHEALNLLASWASTPSEVPATELADER